MALGMTLVREALKYGKYEGCRLSGAGLSAREQIVTRENFRDSLRLDGCRAAVTLRIDGAQQIGAEPE
jgi:hypothetical protein